MRVIALDVGTTQTGWCLLEDYKPIDFGKDDNEVVLTILKWQKYDIMVYEQFVSYGMPIGVSTITSIEWNGRFKQLALCKGVKVSSITRQEEKLNICHSTKANDGTIRQALIDRFAKTPSGKGTKKDPDFFYGFSKDMWSAFAVGVTYLDTRGSK